MITTQQARDMEPTNMLVILADEHNPKVMGHAGHPIVRTPHLDALAARGTRFSAAYCNSPICVPARASMHTGRYVHRVRYWDNATPYDGRVPSWGHRLRESGHRVTSIGKLHFRNGEDDTGFHEQIAPMHVVDGLGDLAGLLRDDPPRRNTMRKYVEGAGPGESTYLDYDRDITRRAVDWLHREAPKHSGKPWVLFVSLVCPHFPFIAPPEFYDLYPPASLPWPLNHEPGRPPQHPGLAEYWRLYGYDTPFAEEDVRRMLAAYLGMVSFTDANVGTILAGLAGSGLGDSTRVIYMSDHGDNLGRDGLFGKSTMFDDSTGVPLLLAGPEVPRGRVNTTPASLVDLYPTLMDGVGRSLNEEEGDLPGASLLDLASEDRPERVVFSEYHAAGSTGGFFMVRKGRHKYVHYVNHPPMLFDLAADPDELQDLTEAAGRNEDGLVAVLEDLRGELYRICDPETVDAQAKADQAAKVALNGGRERILSRGNLAYTPAPGQKPEMGALDGESG